MAESTIDKAFNLFANTDDPLIRQQALTDLITFKAIPKHLDDLRFTIGFEQWCQLATSYSTSDQMRLLTIAELIRISRTARTAKYKWPDRVRKELIPLFEHELPKISLLDCGEKPADDRLNVARACFMMEADWLPGYLAKGIVEEDTGELARSEMIKALFAKTESISKVFVLLTEAITTVQFQTESPGDSMGKRVKRILEALRPVIIGSLVDAGENVGEQLHQMLRKAFLSCERPKDDKVKIEITEEVALVIHDLFRTRLSVAGEPDTFEALRWCRKFFPNSNWPKELQESLEYLIQDVSEALIFLCRQGKPNQTLLDCLEVACGYRERALGITSLLAEKHTELEESMRTWLVRWRVVNSVAASDTLVETQLQSIDAIIGMALLTAQKIQTSGNSVSSQVISTLEIYDPLLVTSLRDVLGGSDQLSKCIIEVAKRRSIDVLGSIGELIEVSPKYFEFAGSIAKSHAIVRQPAIVRKRADGVVGEVVLKGIVE